MAYLLLKAAISGLLVAAASEVARRHAGIGALIASLPLISILGILWLWRDTGEPMFVLIPVMLRAGWGFWISLLAGCLLTFILYLIAMRLMARLGG